MKVWDTFCECGCGRQTRIADKTDRAAGTVKGRPLRFIRGHSGAANPRPPLERLMACVEKRTDGCWYRPGAERAMVIVNHRPELAYRFVYEQLVGPVPEGHVLHHRCGNPRCVNPEHLEPLTPTDHQRLHHLGRRQAYCKRGHLLTDDNRVPGGQCRECAKARKRAWYHAHKGVVGK